MSGHQPTTVTIHPKTALRIVEDHVFTENGDGEFFVIDDPVGCLIIQSIHDSGEKAALDTITHPRAAAAMVAANNGKSMFLNRRSSNELSEGRGRVTQGPGGAGSTARRDEATKPPPQHAHSG